MTMTTMMMTTMTTMTTMTIMTTMMMTTMMIFGATLTGDCSELFQNDVLGEILDKVLAEIADDEERVVRLPRKYRTTRNTTHHFIICQLSANELFQSLLPRPFPPQPLQMSGTDHMNFQMAGQGCGCTAAGQSH